MDEFDSGQIADEMRVALQRILDVCADLEDEKIQPGIVTCALMSAARIGAEACFDTSDVDTKLYELVGISNHFVVRKGSENVH